ncbi:MAG: DUF3854 domain-containing protein [Scytonema sp. PMC 1069.18]|nr:DUF3854 domain-containing protein [Scytonema sp. PMC 1069.18]MEC4887697.1 DUF3854 domain-containing protein [Scytonema sp. PMC 1070.18]
MNSIITIIPEHQQEWTVGSGVSEAIACLNIQSLSKDELNQRIQPKRPIEVDGWWCGGVNWRNGLPMGSSYGQAKPDKPHIIDEKSGKTAKYLTASGMQPDAIFLAMPDKDYWAKVYADDSIIRVWTEGVKKAGSGLTIGLATIALTGVWNWGKDGKLAPEVEKWAQPGTTHVIAFDSDYRDKESCRKAVIAFAKLLMSKGCEVVIASWSQEYKGMDDFIVGEGGDAFKEVIANAQTIKQWEKLFKKDKVETKKGIPPRRAAQQLVESYREQWKYDLEQQVWRNWNKVWGAVPLEVFTQTVYRELETMPNVDYENFSYVENVVKFLKVELLEREWQTFNRMEWIAFNDYVLEVKTGKKHKHAPGFGFTSCLEHNYPKLVAIDPSATLLDRLRENAPTFYSWAMHSQKGDPLKVLKLVAICNGVLKFRFFDLQMFILLVGVPGAGKGTFARLLELMVGKANYGSAKLHKLGDDNTIAAVIDKQLVICPDEKKQTTDYSGLLSLTGDDSIPYRPIYRPQANGKFHGAITVIANQYPFFGDTSGIARRECLVNFDVPIKNRDRSIELKMHGEVPAIIAISLSMPDEEVTELITGTGSSAIPDLKRQQWLHKTENDSVALFMEEMLATSDDNDFILLGGKGDDPSSLYGAYLDFCDANNSKSLFTRNNFRGHLLEICRELGWNHVRESRCGNGWRIYGIRLRRPGDTSPYISDWLASGVDECRECRPSVDPSVDLKPLLDKDSVGSVDLNPIIASEQKNFSEAPKNSNNDIPPSEVYTPTQPLPNKDLDPTQGSTLGQHSLHQQMESDFEVGQKVIGAIGDDSGKLFVVLAVGENRLKVRSNDGTIKALPKTAVTPIPAEPSAELFIKGRKKNVNPSDLVGKKVRVKALGGEEFLVQALSTSPKAPLICKSVDGRPLYIHPDDVE